jgi:hypothetical protein
VVGILGVNVESISSDKILSICIPTYNRKEIVLDNLRMMLNSDLLNQINIYIFDDGDDGLNFDIAQLNDPENSIRYFKNEPRRGHDENILKALTLPDTKYKWLLGDSLYIDCQYFDLILKLLSSSKYDAVIVGSGNERINNFQLTELKTDLELYLMLGWHCTLTGVVIFSDEILKNALPKLNKFKFRNFIQYAILFAGLRPNSKSFVLSNSVVLKNKKRSGSYWRGIPLQVFASDWVAVNSNFINHYGENAVNSVIKSHDLNTHIFSGLMLFYLKIFGGVNNQNYMLLDDVEKGAIIKRNTLYFRIILNTPDIFFTPLRYIIFLLRKIKLIALRLV